MKPEHIYDGVYEDFSEVPEITSYNNEENLASMDIFCREYIEKVFSNGIMENNFVTPTGRTQYTDHLGVLVACILRENNNVTIVDVGGGIGQSFLELCAMIGSDYKKIKYFCFDLKETIDYATKNNGCFANYALGTPIEENLRLISNFAEAENIINDLDIVFVSAALHYFPDKYEILGKLVDLYSPKHILISRTTVVLDTKSFVSVQTLYPLKIPMWFMNHNEILLFLKVRNYALKFKSSIYIEDGPIAENLPRECHNSRLAYYLFSRQ